jgi:NADH-quinone oxidoreductase subunit C
MTPNLESLTAEFTALVARVSRPVNPADTGQETRATAEPAPTSAAKSAALVVPPSGGAAGLPPEGGTTNTVTAPAVSPVQTVAHALKGYNFDATVAPAQVVAAAQIMDRTGFALDAVTGVDWIAQNEMEVVYDFFHPTVSLHAVVRTRVLRAQPELPTISGVFPGANWHERETHDFFGISFLGHPNLKPFLLPEDANFHPLRKDYQP